MTADEVDTFFATGVRTLPAAPEWRGGNRLGERRTSLALAKNGIIGPISVEVTIRLSEPDYLMALMLASTHVICRLCMTTGHRDRLTGELITSAHFHGWEANRAGRKTIPKNLSAVELVPSAVVGRDDAFAWFLDRTGVQHPTWIPVPWPVREELF